MEIFGLLGLLIAGGILIGSILGFVSNARLGRLEQEVGYLRRLLDDGASRPKPTQKAKVAPPNPKPANPIPPPEYRDLKPKPKTAALNSPQKTKTPPPYKSKPLIPAKAKPKKKRRSFEEEIGARWAVWVGGAALALGAIFLLRFAVEAGVFTPAMRVGLAALLGLLSIGAGEWLRRKDDKFFKEKLKMDDAERSAYIPGVLTGVGIFALFGAVYSAYALYDLILPITAFAGMALVSFAALGLSLIQGPRIAGLGVVGALVTPLLVSSDLSNYPMLFSYLAIVTAVSVTLARFKAWGWLALAAMFGAVFWMWTTSFDAEIGKAFWPWTVYAAGLAAAGLWLSRDDTKDRSLFEISFDIQKFASGSALIWFAVWALIVIGMDNTHADETPQHVFAALAAAGLMLAGYLRKNLPQLILIGGFIAFAIVMGYAESVQFAQFKPAEDMKGISVGRWLLTTLSLAALFMGFTALKTKREKTAPAAVWAGLGMSVPIMMLLSGDAFGGLTDNRMAILMLGAVAANIGAAALTPRSDSISKGMTPYIGPAAFYCAGAAIAYTFAVVYGLSPLYITFAFMGGIGLPLVAYRILLEPILKVIALGFALFTVLHVLFVQIANGDHIGTRAIFNALWMFLALPAALCAGAAWIMERDKSDIWAELMKAAALTFAALFAVFQVRHLMNGGDIMSAGRIDFDEMAMQVLVGLSFTLGGMRIGYAKLNQKVSPLSILAMLISLLSLTMFMLGVCLGLNPLINAETIINGGSVFNSLAIGYLLPALALAAIAWMGRETRDALYVRLCGGLSLLSFMLYITAMIRHGFSGDMISVIENWPGDVELYVISAAWLILGVALLALGMKMDRRDIRLASAIVIVLTVLKAFFVDMASLEGALRALSFVVLGVVLIVIGRVYQRLLFKGRTKSEDA